MDIKCKNIINKILIECERLQIKSNVFIFGSSLYRIDFQDIDLIFIYRDKVTISIIKKYINLDSIGVPIDYVFFNERTEQEIALEFFKTIHSRKIYIGL